MQKKKKRGMFKSRGKVVTTMKRNGCLLNIEKSNMHFERLTF
jgi:hypothetical protein